MSATAQLKGREPRTLLAPVKPGGLMDALLAVQAAAPKLRRDGDGQVGGVTYKYVTLGSLVDAVGPLLAEHGLVWLTLPTFGEDGAPALTYRLTHVPSGEALEDTMPLCAAKADPQGMGSALTYARRYSLTAILNLISDEDDDGARAAAPAIAQSAPPRPTTSQAGEENNTAPQPTARPPAASGRPASAKQRGMIQARARAIDLTADEFANVLKLAAGEETVLWQDGAAERWSDRALDRLPARLVDAVLEQIAKAAGEGS